MVPVSSPYYKGGHRDLIRRDIALAKSLAAASGYRGQTIKLATNKRYPQMFDAAVLIQAMAKEAGINFEIETFDWATQFDRYADGDYQAMTFAYSARLDPTFNCATVIGRKADEPRKVWDDPMSQALLAQSAAATDDESRQMAFDKLNARMRELTPLVVTYNPPHVIAWRSGISGVKTWPALQQRLWGVSKKP
jgi:peptide/nickel transport system substrate-binding protein